MADQQDQQLQQPQQPQQQMVQAAAIPWQLPGLALVEEDQFPCVWGDADPSHEPATWRMADGQLAPPARSLIYSFDSRSRVFNVFFKNDAPVPAMLIWKNHCGEEVAYGSINAGCRMWMGRTFTTHPWAARVHLEGADGELGLQDGSRLMLGPSMVAFAERHSQEIVIKEPPVLRWSRTTHKHFPEAFKETVRELLRAHHVVSRQAVQQAQPQPQPPPAYTPPVTRSKTRSACAAGSGCDAAHSFLSLCHGGRRQKKARCMRPLLDLISNDLLTHIISFMAPAVRQCISHGAPSGHPDIQPALLPWDPTADPERKCASCGAAHALGQHAPPPPPLPAAHALGDGGDDGGGDGDPLEFGFDDWDIDDFDIDEDDNDLHA